MCNTFEQTRQARGSRLHYLGCLLESDGTDVGAMSFLRKLHLKQQMAFVKPQAQSPNRAPLQLCPLKRHKAT